MFFQIKSSQSAYQRIGESRQLKHFALNERADAASSIANHFDVLHLRMYRQMFGEQPTQLIIVNVRRETANQRVKLVIKEKEIGRPSNENTSIVRHLVVLISDTSGGVSGLVR